MSSIIRPVISSAEGSDEATTTTTLPNTMSFILRHIMSLAASLPIAFLPSKLPISKATALLCAMSTFYSLPMTPRTAGARVICTLSLVLSITLYYINGGIPQNQEDDETIAVLFILYFNRQQTSYERLQTPECPKEIFHLWVENILLSLINYFYAIIVTGNPPTSGPKPGARLFIFLWPWVITPAIVFYQSWWRQRYDASG
ncbi:hypothetical protein F4808DRAFT_62577 [Astrocystis sublimbata]|nr:hypothetical protein F4808DRAFT_62577 [Astrocystis sublimbata]